jgi:hypothetical protein
MEEAVEPQGWRAAMQPLEQHIVGKGIAQEAVVSWEMEVMPTPRPPAANHS